jgi:hypothetical protein
VRPVLRPTLAAVCLLAVCLLAIGCAGPEPTGGPATRDPGPDATRATPRPTPDPTAVANAAVFGNWRRTPVPPSPVMAGAAERACRSQGDVGSLPLRVLDARGEGQLTLVFADESTTMACHAEAADDGTMAAFARAIEGLADAPPPVDGHLGAHNIEVIESPSGARVVVVGRIADVPEVGISFDDSTWGKATIADGWYAAWWPQGSVPLSVASVDRRNIVIDSFPVAP